MNEQILDEGSTTMPDHPTEPEPDRDDTDAGYRDTLEEEAYEQADSGASGEPERSDEES